MGEGSRVHSRAGLGENKCRIKFTLARQMGPKQITSLYHEINKKKKKKKKKKKNL